MAAAGRTSREIAQALYVTTKTVDTDLGHVVPEARDQLAQTARRGSERCRVGH
jgi:DNA-directed RNA polymerase specialized sigma24 family protein